MLLKLGQGLIAVRSRDQLLQLIDDQLRALRGLRILCIGMPDEEQTFWTCWLYYCGPAERSGDVFARQLSARFPLRDGLFNETFRGSAPHIWQLKTLLSREHVPAFIRSYEGSALVSMVGSPLRAGSRTLGCLYLFFDEDGDWVSDSKQELSVLASQFGACVSNILINRQMADQLEEISRYKEMLEEERNEELVSVGEAMRKVFTMVSQVAETPTTVLINGETGTGKELVARAIHRLSGRRDKMMIKVNCAAIPGSLIESELFGHEKGSFTGATERRIGKFELAHNGTLFLDEIGELPLELQSRLLRVLQEREVERIGGRTVVKTDVRIIAATNRDLQKEVIAGNFRPDLFYRLHVFPVLIPPLRERKEDIPTLAAHFLVKHARKGSRSAISISPPVMKQLMAYNWPGNVRELEHLIERSVLLTSGPAIDKLDLQFSKPAAADIGAAGRYIKTIGEVERDHILSVLRLCDGKISGEGGAAEKLRIAPTTLSSKIKRLGIKRGINEH